MIAAPLYPEAAARFRARRAETVRAILSPPPKLTVSEWADRYRILSKESAAEAGRWSTDRTPYLREIMDCFTDPTVHRVVFKKCARIGGTEVANNITGYFIDQDPSPILSVQPTVDDAKNFSKEQLAPMIRDTPRLRRKVRNPLSRNSGNTLQAKAFPGGFLVLVGANAPTGFRRRTVRVVILDEVDGYAESAGTEGDQVELATNRTTTFADPKVFIPSTPTIKGFSRIDREYKNSDERVYLVPCPSCEAFQELVWEQMRWADLPEPRYACRHCGDLIPEQRKAGMVAAGRWVPENPGHPVRGYRINQLYSPFAGAAWPVLVAKFEEAQNDPQKLQVFYNTRLGLSFEAGDAIRPEDLQARREKYAAPCPAGVLLLTAGTDVQQDRLEMVVKGWGPGFESWLIDRVILYGDPAQEKVWKDLDEAWRKRYDHELGGQLRIATMAVDYGYLGEHVMNWVRPRQGLGVFAVKGEASPGKPFVPRRATLKTRHGGRVWMLGVSAGKDTIFQRLKIRPPAEHPTGPHPAGFMHLPLEDWCDDDYIAQLTAERPVPVNVNGVWRRRWVCPADRRSEALDCENYALAAVTLGRHRLERMKPPKPKDPPPEPPASTPEPDDPIDPPPASPRPRRKPQSFRGWNPTRW